MSFSEAAEEILEGLWIAREERNLDSVKLSELLEMPDAGALKELLDSGIVERCADGALRLTDEGFYHASDAIRRHRLAERLLADVLSVKGELLHDTACQFEHHLHKGIDANVCTLLGHPRLCPHGKHIPPGRCCEERMKLVSPAVLPLADLKHGQEGQICYLHTPDTARAQMLLSMGLVPGINVKLLTNFPSYLFQLGDSRFAIDKELAREIYVRLS